MHDCKGRELKVGDTVLVPFTIKETYATEEYCNASLQTVASMFPGDQPTTLTVNTQQIIRANEGDDVAYTVVHDGAATRIK